MHENHSKPTSKWRRYDEVISIHINVQLKCSNTWIIYIIYLLMVFSFQFFFFDLHIFFQHTFQSFYIVYWRCGIYLNFETKKNRCCLLCIVWLFGLTSRIVCAHWFQNTSFNIEEKRFLLFWIFFSSYFACIWKQNICKNWCNDMLEGNLYIAYSIFMFKASAGNKYSSICSSSQSEISSKCRRIFPETTDIIYVHKWFLWFQYAYNTYLQNKSWKLEVFDGIQTQITLINCYHCILKKKFENFLVLMANTWNSSVLQALIGQIY